jgi:CO dehydrogenase/acetyl-CoA synthase beta subunit
VVNVEGFETEAGSVYSHDIEFVQVDGKWERVEHTPAQIKLKEQVRAMEL